MDSTISREGRDLGVAFQAPPGSQASSRGEAKDSALLSSRDARNAGDVGSILDGGTKKPQALEQLSLFDSTTKPARHS